MDSTLEQEHPKFIQLSQYCNDLVRRFDFENVLAAARIRKQFDSVTQTWENIVTCLEEQSNAVSFDEFLDPAYQKFFLVAQGPKRFREINKREGKHEIVVSI